MPDPVTRYLEANDNADDYAEYLLANLEQSAREDIDDLFNNDARRDDDLWVAMGVNSELKASDYEADPIVDRDLDWVTGYSGLAAASGTQFLLDNRQDTIIRPVAYREQVLSGIVLTREQLIAAGKRTVEIVSESRYQILRAQYLGEFGVLAQMDNVELYSELLQYGALRPADQVIADASGYVARMTQYRAGTPQYKEAVTQLIDMESTRGLKQQVRRSTERLYSYREANADLATMMVWIGEGGPRACRYCTDRYGSVQTYGDWIADGLPGAEVCAGGDYCRCHLAAA